jgi:hypothetical protein
MALLPSSILPPDFPEIRGAQTAAIRGRLNYMATMKRKPISAKAKRRAPLPTHSEDGVDLTLIRWMLSLTPAKRLKVLQDNARAILRLRGETS